MRRSFWGMFVSIASISLMVGSSLAVLSAPLVSAQPPPPAIAVSPSQGPVGSTFTVGGSAFSASSNATVSFNGVLQVPGECSEGTFSGITITTDGTGLFVCTFAVPVESAGTYPVMGEDNATSTPTAVQMFTVTTPMIELNPRQGPVGARYTVGGFGFNASSNATVLFNGAPQAPSECSEGAFNGMTVVTDTTGIFVCTFTVPNAGAGAYSVVGQDTATGTPTPAQTITVTTPQITESPGQGPEGATVTVLGTGFSPSTSLAALSLASETVSGCTRGSLMLSVMGSLNCTFTVPTVGSGTTTLTATDVGGQTATKPFRVTSTKITVSPGQGLIGTSVTASGTGFSVSTALTSLDFDAAAISGCTSGSMIVGATGSFSCNFVVPMVGSGKGTVSATDVGGQTASTTFTVTTPKIATSPGLGPMGATVTVSGTGFSVSSTVRLVFGAALGFYSPSGLSCELIWLLVILIVHPLEGSAPSTM
jgi:hypothetical protein